MNSKLLGGILLMVGCTIGAGILGLPIATASLGFFPALLLLTGAWLIMTLCGFLVLEVNLWLPKGSNYSSMASATLGKVGQAITWVIYLVLLYAFICAYIAGGGDLFHYLLGTIGLTTSISTAILLFTSVFGIIVYLGMRSIDYVNRGLMLFKMGSFILLILSILPFISIPYLTGGAQVHCVTSSSIMVVASCFGSLMIVPTLRSYFGDDIRSLRQAIVIGFFISFLCFVAWDFAVLGVIPWQGASGLQQMIHSGATNSDILKALQAMVHKPSVLYFAKFFTSICMMTSFLSIALCLTDFLSDGFKLQKKGWNNAIIFGSALLPPLAIVLFYPGGFIRALEYAGICIIILMVLMPPLMVWRGRYHHQLVHAPKRAFSHKVFLASLMLFAITMIGIGLRSAA